MMAMLIQRGAALANERSAALAVKAAAALRESVPRARVEVDGGYIAVSGRGLMRRWLTGDLRFWRELLR